MLEELTCNSCGAPLEVRDSADFVTCNHCSTWLAVRRTDNITFTEQLDRLTEKTEELSERLDNLSCQNDLETFDREWSFEREKYMISGGGRMRSIPETRSSVVGGRPSLSALRFPPHCLVRSRSPEWHYPCSFSVAS